VAGHVGLELGNVVPNYPFESPRRFPGPNRILATETIGVGDTQLGPNMNPTFLAAVKSHGGPGAVIHTASGTVPAYVNPPDGPGED
jgi:hypothetical protein